MFRNILLASSLLIVLLVSGNASAQGLVDDSFAEVQIIENTGPSHIITTSPLTIFDGEVMLNYEHVLTDLISLEFGLGGGNPSTGQYEDVLSFTAEMGVRFYLTDDAPTGFFVSPSVHSTGATPMDSEVDVLGTETSVQLDMGYSWLLWDVVDLSVDWGIGYGEVELSGDDAEGSDLDTVLTDGLAINGRILVGVAF